MTQTKGKKPCKFENIGEVNSVERHSIAPADIYTQVEASQITSSHNKDRYNEIRVTSKDI